MSMYNTSMLPLVVLGLIIISLASAQQEPFRFALAYGDHMVLQAAPKQPSVWGFASAGATVSVTLSKSASNQVVYTGDVTVGADGTWKHFLPATSAGSTAYKISATSSNSADSIELLDVLFGRVWICGGQSNVTISHLFCHCISYYIIHIHVVLFFYNYLTILPICLPRWSIQ